MAVNLIIQPSVQHEHPAIPFSYIKHAPLAAWEDGWETEFTIS